MKPQRFRRPGTPVVVSVLLHVVLGAGLLRVLLVPGSLRWEVEHVPLPKPERIGFVALPQRGDLNPGRRRRPPEVEDARTAGCAARRADERVVVDPGARCGQERGHRWQRAARRRRRADGRHSRELQRPARVGAAGCRRDAAQGAGGGARPDAQG